MSNRPLAPTHFVELLDEIQILVAQKNAAYSDGLQGNVPDPWANLRSMEPWGVTAEQYVLLRLQEKMNRVRTLRKNPKLQANDESLRDSAIDSAVYWLIYVCLLDENDSAPDVGSGIV